MKPLIPPEKIEELRCIVCKNYLSVPPIYYTKDNAYRCGRCAFLKDNSGTRAQLYEKVVSGTSFPCIYKGCKEKVEWGKVSTHEQVCPQRVLECPFCSESGLRANSIQTHLTSAHDSLRFSPQLWKLDEIETRSSNYFIPVGNDSFILSILQNTDYLAFGVYSIFSESSSFVFDIGLKTTLSSISLYDQRIVPFSSDEKCKKCWINTCQNPLHKEYFTAITSNIFKEMTTKVKKNYLRNFLGQSLDHTIISVNIKNKRKEEEHTNYEHQILECYVCRIVMSPPIHFCMSGHSVCNDCKLSNNRCPSCKYAWTKSRNLSLEYFSENVILSCDNKIKGCDIIGFVKDIREHERMCHYKKK